MSDPESESDWRRIIARYCGLVALVDRSVGIIIQALEDAGISENTVVVFTSEHEDQLGEHYVYQKGVFYEQSMRVPFLIRVPWFGSRQEVIEGRWSDIDLVPTLLDLVGAPIPSRLPGKSAVPLLRGETDLSDNDVVIDWNGRDIEPNQDADLHRVESPPHRGLISSDGWKLKLAVGDVNELYDLNSDPSERRNLIDDPTQIARIRDMASRIRDWQLQTEDSAPLPSF